jgi:hypothetical protein
MDYVAIDHWSAQIVPIKILVMTDYYSRYLWYKLVKSTTSAETIEACEQIFDVFGKPKTIRADNGTAFASEEFKEWCGKEDIRVDFSVPLWPQHNGQVENCMKFINKTLKIARVKQENWKESLKSAVQFFNNSRVHSVTGCTPAEMMFGRRLRGTLPSAYWKPSLDEDEIRDNDLIEKHKGKEAADQRRHAKESSIKEGDLVFMRAKGDDKLAARFNISKPVKVLKKEGATVTLDMGHGKVSTRNVTAVKKNLNGSLLEEKADEATEEAMDMDMDSAEGFFLFISIFQN